jgi:hypothetical protein
VASAYSYTAYLVVGEKGDELLWQGDRVQQRRTEVWLSPAARKLAGGSAREALPARAQSANRVPPPAVKREAGGAATTARLPRCTSRLAELPLTKRQRNHTADEGTAKPHTDAWCTDVGVGCCM